MGNDDERTLAEGLTFPIRKRGTRDPMMMILSADTPPKKKMRKGE